MARRLVLVWVMSLVVTAVVATAGAVPLDHEIRVTAADPAVDDEFGASIAVSGNTMVVGAPWKGSGRGAAYVFVLQGGSWVEQAKLEASDGTDDDNFGHAVAIHRDTVVVGAYSRGSNGTSLGAAYVYTRQGDAWEEASLARPEEARWFGRSVAIDGDVVVVGASGTNGFQGSAYVFVRQDDEWAVDGTLVGSDIASTTDFGESVAVGGGRVVVGADNQSWNAAYVFERAEGGWVEEEILRPSDSPAGNVNFGRSVAAADDLVVVGASGVNVDGVTGAGAVYVYRFDGEDWAEETLVASDPGPQDRLGHGVALLDGVIAAGAPGAAVGGVSNAGAVYLFTHDGSQWDQERLTVAEPGFNDQVGWALAASSGRLAAGARGAEVSGNKDAGAAFVFSPTPSVIRYAGPDRFATAVEVSKGDFPDGADTVLVAVGSDFPDALAGAAIAPVLGAPVLLVQTNAIPAVTAQELERLDPEEIVILGGPAVVSPAVETALSTHADSVTRVFGANRFETAVEISKSVFVDGAEEVVVATGENFPDALGGGPVAATLGGPVLLTRTGSLPDVVRDEIVRLGASRITVLGGPAAVSDAVVAELETLGTVTRVFGPDRYATAVAAADLAFDAAGRVYIAVGTNFPDALAGAGVAGAFSSPVLLVQTGSIPQEVAALISGLAPHTIVILGGTTVISSGVEAQLAALLGI